MAWQLTIDDVDDFALGCALLGSGGGGDARLAAPLLHAGLAIAGPLEIADADAPDPKSAVALVGAVGNASVLGERLPSGAEFAVALEQLQRAIDTPVTAVALLEIGGANGLLGLLAALKSGRTVIDADGMGRAFARLEQCVLTGVVDATPLVLADRSGGSAVLQALPPGVLDRAVEALLPAFGAWAAIACFPTTAEVVNAYAVRGSIGRALRLGRTLSALARGQTLIQECAELRLLGVGTVGEVLRPPGRQLAGVLTIIEAGERGRTLRIDHAEAFEAVTIDGQIVVRGPDVIALCDAHTWRPLGVADVRVGQRVRVLAALIDPRARGRAREPEWVAEVAAGVNA